MRIISGKAGRTAIRVHASVTRPSTDFVRQALFSVLGELVVDARVLDLFAGSGALGLEALSRGASSCHFVENHRQAVKMLAENLSRSRLEGGRITHSDAISLVKRDSGSYDLVFADPPYWKAPGDPDHVRELLTCPNVPQLLAIDGFLIIEVSTHYRAPIDPPWELVQRREYGSSAIHLLRRAPAPTAP